MTESEFIAELTAVLDRQSDAVRTQIPLLLATFARRCNTPRHAPSSPRRTATVFFTVRASVDGPNLYVINKSMRRSRRPFLTQNTSEDGVQPPIPIVDCFDVDYPVNDIVVDCAAKWLQTVWRSIGDIKCGIPVVIVGHDDFGTVTPIELHSGAAA